MANIIINGIKHIGRSLFTRSNMGNTQIMVDGNQVYFGISPLITITIQGDVDTIDTGCGNIVVKGNTGKIKTGSGDIEITGSVTGDVSTGSGDVVCGKVIGSIKTGSGDVTHR